MDPIRIRAEVFAVAAAPQGTAVELAAATIAADRGAPFRGRSRLPIGSRWLAADDARAWRDLRANPDPTRRQSLGTASGVVAGDVRTWIHVDDTPLPALQLTRVAAGVAATLITAGLDATEELSIAVPVEPDASAAVFVPGGVGASGGYVLEFSGVGAPDPGEAEEASVAARRRAADPQTVADRPAAWRTALAAVGEHNRRPALLALVGPLDLPRVVDLVLAADEPALVAMTAALTPLDPFADGVAWRIERAAWQALLPRLERDDLTAALAAALSRHLGAVADDPAQLMFLLQVAGDCAAFAGALHEENVAALGDRSAAVRVRANAWLAARDAAVAGYDPLGDERSRRRALRRYRARLAAEERR